MWRRRLTIFRDLPDIDRLREMSVHNWRLFRHAPSDVYLLDDDDPENPTPILGSHYDSLVRVADVPCPEFDAFLEANPGKLSKYSIYPEILSEALFLSDAFQTLVLSYYGDDEASDFVAVAENGVLKRLRVSRYEEKVRTLSEDEARSIDTEIQATNVSKNAPDDDACDVSEYLLYELLKTEDRDIRFEPYGRFIEGEIGRQVIYKELWQSPEDTPFSLIFRNAHLELQHVFGLHLPDYIEDIADDFELVDEDRSQPSRTALTPSKPRKKSPKKPLWKTLFGSVKSRPIFTGIVLIILAGAFFGQDDAGRSEGPPTFERVCAMAGGEPVNERDRSAVSPGLGKRCIIDNMAFPQHLIPAPAGDERSFGAFYKYAPCMADASKSCLTLDGEELYANIEGFEAAPDESGIALIDRTTLCQPAAPGICLDGSFAFRYKLRRKFGSSSESPQP